MFFLEIDSGNFTSSLMQTQHVHETQTFVYFSIKVTDHITFCSIIQYRKFKFKTEKLRSYLDIIKCHNVFML